MTIIYIVSVRSFLREITLSVNIALLRATYSSAYWYSIKRGLELVEIIEILMRFLFFSFFVFAFASYVCTYLGRLTR